MSDQPPEEKAVSDEIGESNRQQRNTEDADSYPVENTTNQQSSLDDQYNRWFDARRRLWEKAQDAGLAPRTPEPSAQATTSRTHISVNINGMGILVDRWAEIIEGKADIAETVRNSLIKILQSKKMPDIRIRLVTGTLGITSLNAQRRPYIIAETEPGVKTAIYVAPHGNDLYVSWRTHVRGVINTKLLSILAVTAATPTLCLTPCLLIGSIVGGTFGTGRFDLGGSLAPFFGVFMGFLLFEALIVALAGFFLRGDFLAYFFVEPTIFDAEDVIALSLSVHKGLQKAVAETGTSVKAWESKTNFKSGRKSEAL